MADYAVFVSRIILKLWPVRRYTDWTPEYAVTHKQFPNLYSQFPYDSHFTAIFDCCHSGVITRESARKASRKTSFGAIVLTKIAGVLTQIK